LDTERSIKDRRQYGYRRGKRLVVLVGQKRALAMAVKGKQIGRRWSKLKDRLVGVRAAA